MDLRIEPVSVADSMVFKLVRLRALREDPTAFGSTHAEESRLTDAEWVDLAVRRTTNGSMVWLAFADEVPCGIVGVFLERATQARLVSMWVAKEQRGQGIGKALVEAAVAWARESEARTMVLTVTSNNDSAAQFYEGVGFARTGRTEPYPNDPALLEHEMELPLSLDTPRS
jgi:GNAT superfamily N-acetyltransferase